MPSAKVSQALQDALHELERERARIDTAISNLRHLVDGVVGGVHRGRPAGKVAAKPVVKVARTSVRKPVRPRASAWTAAKRNAAALRMKKYWADKRNAAPQQQA